MLNARFQPPPALHPRDRVAVIAPASAFDRPAFEAGLALIGARYHAGYGPGVFERHRYLAGDAARRLGELTAALSDPEARAVFCARGGYGAMRLLARLAHRGPAGPPKLLVGFSDITALHLWLQTLGRISVHGPVLTQLGRLPPGTCERLFSVLESTSPASALQGTLTCVGGVAEGPLLGGNLSVVTRLIGTPFMPELDGADRKSTRLNSSHDQISYAVFCLKKKKKKRNQNITRLNSIHDFISNAVLCLREKWADRLARVSTFLTSYRWSIRRSDQRQTRSECQHTST